VVILDQSNFYETIAGFYTFENKVEEFSEQSFRNVYNSACAGKYKNIVYILRSKEKVSRLKGESDILYIGQTKHSFKKRYSPYSRLHVTSEANKLKFEHIIRSYGSISISVSDFSLFSDTLLQAEGQLLWWYFQNHCEYPPINYTKTSVRNRQIVTSGDVWHRDADNFSGVKRL